MRLAVTDTINAYRSDILVFWVRPANCPAFAFECPNCRDTGGAAHPWPRAASNLAGCNRQKRRAWYISTTASTSLRTLIVPDGSPPLVQGRRPPKWQLVHVIGTRCSIDFHPAARKLRGWYISITAFTSLRTLTVPDASPPLVHDHENLRPASSRPSRCQRRTSIDL